jgi:hypothetical protein
VPILGVVGVEVFARLLVLVLASRPCVCVVAVDGRRKVCVAPFGRLGLFQFVSIDCTISKHRSV